MPRPNVDSLLIDLPSIDTPLADATGQACGQTFAQALSIRQPYKGVTTNEVPLSSIVSSGWSWEDSAVHDDVYDAAKGVSLTMAGLDPLVKFKFQEHTHVPEDPTGEGGGGSEGGGLNLGSSVPADVHVVADAANQAAITNLYQRAYTYLRYARDLRDYWATEFEPETSVAAWRKGWPLFEGIFDVYPICKDRPPGYLLDSPEEGWAFGEFRCPGTDTLQQHEDDAKTYRDLIRAAAHWARCGQEAVRVVAMHYLNKRDYDLAHPPGEGGLQLAPPSPPPIIPGPGVVAPPVGPGVPPVDPTDPTPGGGDLPGPEPDPPPPEPLSPAPADEFVPKRGLAALSTPAKVALVGAGAFVAYKLLGKR